MRRSSASFHRCAQVRTRFSGVNLRNLAENSENRSLANSREIRRHPGVGDEFPNRIRELRKAHDLRLEDLAVRVGCSTSFISDLERGVRDLGYQWMIRIAKALRVRPTDLFNADDRGVSLSFDERRLVHLYGEASEEQRWQIREMLKVIVRKPDRSQR